MARTYRHAEQYELTAGENPWVFVQTAVSYLRDQIGDEYLLWVNVTDSKGTTHTRDLEQAHAEWASDEYQLLRILVTLTLDDFGNGYTISADHLDPSLQNSKPTISISGDDANEAAVIGRVQVAMEKAKRAGANPAAKVRTTSDEPAVSEEPPIALETPELPEAARQLEPKPRYVPVAAPMDSTEPTAEPERSALSRVTNHPWVVTVVGGLLVAGIVAAIALLW